MSSMTKPLFFGLRTCKKMKTKLLFVLMLVIVGQSCKQETKMPVAEIKEEKVDYPKYELMGEKDHVLVESFDASVVDINKYNHNNVVFKVGAEFIYAYEHITPEGKVQYFKKTKNDRAWEFVDPDSLNFSTIQTIKISVMDGNPMANGIPDYNQTNLKYQYLDNDSYSMSGVIENEANIWMHPPRDYYFEILELNPFPYIKAPYEIGHKWNWRLEIGDGWADERWKVWDGMIENIYTYEIIDKTVLETELGTLDCFIIKSNAKSRIGQTKLIAFFNEKYGFVKLNYTNIDGSKTNLNLIDYHFKPEVRSGSVP